jgi:hypothetical protein
MIEKSYRSNVYCLWYPTGGFGHWLSACISATARDFYRIDHQDIFFSPEGDSHAAPLMAPKYLHNADSYDFEFDPEQKYVVLIDNGINDESRKFQQFFPDAITIRITYDDLSWPIVAATMVAKTQGGIDRALCLDNTAWRDDADWARREKYFLYLRDHDLRQAWRSTDGCYNINVNQLLNPDDLRRCMDGAGIYLGNFEGLWLRWRLANARYLDPVDQAADIMLHLRENRTYDLSAVQDLWSQAVINYYIWIYHGIEVPANDYADWFADWDDLCRLLQK